ncbi:MAG TPA: hypothetical protein VGD33_11395 [Chitinophagaceae bacterium]
MLRALKLGLISLVIIFLLITAISLLIPSQVRISKAIDITAPESSVLQMIKDTGTWKNWYPAFQSETALLNTDLSIKTITSTDSKVEMELTKAGKNALVNGWEVYTHGSSEDITLQWYMDFRLGWYPWEKFGSLFYESSYGAMMEQGLMNLKNLAEKE